MKCSSVTYLKMQWIRAPTQFGAFMSFNMLMVIICRITQPLTRSENREPWQDLHLRI